MDYDLSDFDTKFINWKIHHKTTPCIKDEFVINEIKQYLQAKIDQEVKKNDENIKRNIGLLRQWLNERTSKDLITNEQIERWLFNEEIPMGISQWKEIGIKYGYYEYFRREEVKKIVEEIKEEVLSAKYGTKNRVELLCKLNSYLK